MTTYKLNIDHRTEQVMSVCKDDNYGIPFDSGNADYQEFLDWLNEGNTITDNEIPAHVLTEATDKKSKQQLIEYTKAKARLSQYVLSEGQLEIKRMMPTGEKTFNKETKEIDDVLTEIIVQYSIDPVPLTIEVGELNKATMEMTFTTVDNPAVVRDLAERAAAQAIVADYETTIG